MRVSGLVLIWLGVIVTAAAFIFWGDHPAPRTLDERVSTDRGLAAIAKNEREAEATMEKLREAHGVLDRGSDYVCTQWEYVR